MTQQQQQYETSVRTATAEHASQLPAARDALVAEMRAQGWSESGTPYPFAGGCAETHTFIRPFGVKRHA